MRSLSGVAVVFASLVACIPGGGIGGDSFDPELVVTIPSLDGGVAFEAERVPLVVDIAGADNGATVTASAGGVPWATFHWPEDDRADLVLGQGSSTWSFLLTVGEDDDAKYPDYVERTFGVTWSNPNPVGVEVCDATTCAPAEEWGELVAPVTLRPSGTLDDAVETTWFISDLLPVAGDADGGAPWTWDPGPTKSYDVRVHVARDGAPDSFGLAHVVVAAS